MNVAHTLLLAWYLVMLVLVFAAALNGVKSKPVAAFVAILWPLALPYGIYQGLNK